jgi:predicted nucleic acid-binding protein
MRISLDTCSLQRPLDDKTQIRIILEADAVLGILGLCEAGALELVSSDALHLASAEAARAELFCTCDDRLLKKARKIEGLQTRVVSPLEAIGEIEQ